ncbi:BC85_0335 family putative methyltransferase [Metamycoplasma canadense]|uniref:Uncharacterized protein n=1 Tax=Metamycoplasma canadense TaxID=29554 RepID=A0A077L957_9BACT|nr:hypothetical protein [Metamycoplasma canadense]BAP39548.1 hypothetical protein MCAN360_0368 [Metamycoplasma canadense]
MKIINEYASLLNNKESKISADVRLGLIISLVIVFIIGLTAFIITFLYKKKIVKKYVSPREEDEKNKLKKINPNYGVVLDGIKKFYDSELNDFFICFVINTIYLNNYENIYCEDKNNYLALSISNLANKQVFLNNKKNVKLNNEIKNEFENIKFDLISYTSEINKKSDLIILLNNNLEFKKAIESKLSFLSENGMIIIENDKQLKFKNIKDIALFFNLRYETLKFKNKSVILLAKNNIKDIVEKGED